MSLISGSTASYIGADQLLVDQIVYELKSQGIFDSFRKECIADVDTKPAYQNLRQRVEGSVSSFLKEQRWNPESNKNQLREMLRKNIYESGFLETGVERIVNQVVNPKINTVFLPKVKEVFYKFIGLQTPTTTVIGNASIDVDTYIVEVKKEPKMETEPELNLKQDLLPTDLEAVSPENDNGHIHDNNETTQDSNSMAIDDDDTSPPFEPIDEDLSFKLIPMEENSIDSHLSGMSGLASHDSQNSNKDRETTVVMQQLLESDSQISKNSSSDDRLSIVTDDASNTKVDMLVVNDGVVVAIATPQPTEENEDSKDKILNMEVDSEISQETRDDAMDKVSNDDLEDVKIKEEMNDLKVKDLIPEEDSKATLSFETSDSTKQSILDTNSKPSSSYKKETSKDQKKDNSRHHSNSKFRDSTRDSKDYRDSKEKSYKSKSMSSTSSTKDRDKDSKSKSTSSSSSNRHSSDKDKERSHKKYSSSNSKDKDKGSLSNNKDKSNSKDKDKDSTSGSKDKESNTSSKHKESSSKDHSSSKSTSLSRDKSSSKDHSKDSKSKSSSSDKHRSSSGRKYSSSSTSRVDSSKSHSSSSSSKDKRDKKENSTKDDHFSSKSQRTERRSTDRDSNDGQTRSKGTSNTATTLLSKSDEQRSSNNTTEDSSSSNSNSKDGSNTDSCQTGEASKIVPNKMEVGCNKGTENVDNLQPVVVLTLISDLDNLENSKVADRLENSENKDNTVLPLASSLAEVDNTSSTLTEKASPDLVETLDAIKSHLAEYKLDEQKDVILPEIKLPKFASNMREARKMMKLRKQLKQQNKLRKLLLKGTRTEIESTEQAAVGEVTYNENGDEIENKETSKDKENTDDNTSDNSLLLLEQDLSNDATVSPIKQVESSTENKETDNTVEESPIKEHNNDDCMYLDRVTDKTTRYLNYTTSFMKKMDKEMSAQQNKMTAKITKRKGQKRKISTLSSDSSIYNDSITDEASISSKVSSNATHTYTEDHGTTVGTCKTDAVVPPNVGESEGVTSATAHVQVVKQRRINNTKATQRYTSDDLYKPRPFLKGTTKRTSGRVAN